MPTHARKPEPLPLPGARFAELQLPEVLPPGISAAEAEVLLSDLKGSRGAEFMAAKVGLLEHGVFPEEVLFPDEDLKGEATPAEELAEPASPAATAGPRIVGRTPTQRDLEAENIGLAGVLRHAAANPEVVALLGPDVLQGAAQRKIARVFAGLAEDGVALSDVLVRIRLSTNHEATACGALNAFEEVLRLNPPDLALFHEVAAHIRALSEARREEEARKELSRLALDGNLGNGKLREEAAKILEVLAGPGGPGEKPDEFFLRAWPKPRDEAHLYGIAGEIIRTIDPLTEADPMAILGQFLAAFGNMCGRDACWYHESSRHALNLFLVVAGPTAFGCKGTSLDVVEDILDGVDPSWMKDGLDGGLISGEGLIHAVRDPTADDLGVDDKRVLAVEIEFGSVLTVMARRGNTLSPQIRKAWDGKPFGLMSRNAPARSSGYHISIIGHITFDELDKKFANEEAMNGFGNRFLWLCSRQSKVVPRAGKRRRMNWTKLGIRGRLRGAIEFARSEAGKKDGLVLVLEKKADLLWDEVSAQLKKPMRGILGAIRGRAAPQVMRIAMIYAILDQSSYIRVEHIQAALTVWDYCEQSAAFIFGDTPSDTEVDFLYDALALAGEEGLTMTEIRRKVYKNHPDATARMRRALESLHRSGMAEQRGETASVTTARRWVARV